MGSRTEPQLALHRLRAHGQLHEVRDAELRLTRAETSSLLLQFGIELDDAAVDVLAARTEGWATGVQMAAVSLRDESVPDLFLTEFAQTPRSITDFLGTEILERQPPEILDFLLATSILEHLGPDSCVAVTQRRDAGELLERVGDRHLFLIELGRDTYRYHHLFGDLLRHRLHAEDPDREQGLHRRAAEFFIEAGDIESAFDHFLRAGEEARAFELLRSGFVAAYVRGDGRMVHRIAIKAGAEAAIRDPGRLVDLALALAATAPAGQATPWINRATDRAGDFDDADRARLVLARALVGAQYGAADDVEQELSAYPAPKDLPDDEVAQYGPTLVARTRLWLGDLTGAREICEQNLDPLIAPSLQQVALTGALAWIACVDGQLTEAERLADRALRDAESVGLAAHTAMVDAIRTRGRVAFERGDLATAERVLEQSLSVSEDYRPAFALVSQLSLSRVWLADGRAGDALSGVERARALLPPESTSPLLDLCHASEGRIAVEIGDLDRATQCAQRLRPGNRASLLKARIELARSKPDRADDAIAQCAPTTMRERLDTALLCARIAHVREPDAADPLLAKALATAKIEGFVVAASDDLLELRPRVTLLLRSGRIQQFEQAVLDRLERNPTLRIANSPTAGPLSDRELTVVRFLASRLTYKEIAAELFVSNNTLKTHVKRIFQKLGVSSRMEAVTEARRLSLF
jgi:LuxR family maltose regulon positive regulatory protein